MEPADLLDQGRPAPELLAQRLDGHAQLRVWPAGVVAVVGDQRELGVDSQPALDRRAQARGQPPQLRQRVEGHEVAEGVQLGHLGRPEAGGRDVDPARCAGHRTRQPGLEQRAGREAVEPGSHQLEHERADQRLERVEDLTTATRAQAGCGFKLPQDDPLVEHKGRRLDCRGHLRQPRVPRATATATAAGFCRESFC